MFVKVWEGTLRLRKTPVPSYTIIVHEWGHDFLHWLPLLTNPLGCTLSMCVSSQAHLDCLLFWSFSLKLRFFRKLPYMFNFLLLQFSLYMFHNLKHKMKVGVLLYLKAFNPTNIEIFVILHHCGYHSLSHWTQDFCHNSLDFQWKSCMKCIFSTIWLELFCFNT
jgi:hypothetical protein